ncbi:alpha-L-fucosidase [Actinomyces sp. B33]|uniref:alpha-L-fucosidase n=1 Tax=Actinomyces sp. B33 TaxID=2942131 RepID=UPI0023402C69|nr:alpha-L-fucosidase [Actinomyces sp. B33]MDC4232492.1 alpha-L-fucosidase [Actinomyces sp. B33]
MRFPSVPVTYTATSWEDLARPTPQWYADTPLGFFVHWGAYSVPAWAEDHGELGTESDWAAWFTHNSYAEWYYNTIRIDGSPAQVRHRDLYGSLDYDSFLDMWDASAWDPDDWTRLFVRAGADYAVLTTKHHDGITLWDAPETGSRNTVRRGPRRNIVEEFCDSTRAAGMRVGLYYSGGLDWHYRPFPPIMADEECNDLFRPKDAEYARYAFVHSKDLIDRYRPDVYWNDINWPDAGKNFSEHGLGRLMEHFYAVCPEGVTNDRYGGVHSDFLTSEYQHFGASEEAAVWENCRGVGLSFGYNRNEGPEQYLDGPGAVRHLIDVVAKGGRLLLDVGPRADGSLPDEQVAALEGLAEFMGPHKVELVGGSVVPGGVECDGWARALAHEDHAAVFVDASASRVGALPAGFDWSRAVASRGRASYVDGALAVEVGEGVPAVVTAPMG